ncbi:MAG: hypothetical protein GF418_12085, partial [Chitinivibrionales bacterium]|nr:hypothetical protein [Chitinivibrionales bacterium]MBD3396357.1 hypothetical protein [Chitinivibrionales bacterium]
MQRQDFSSRILIAAALCGACACVDPVTTGSGGGFRFAVLDVGQGLAQAGVRKGNAVVWDTGDSSAVRAWGDGMDRLGPPFVKAIVVSHGDMDHKGGLGRLPAGSAFSGEIVVSPYEDTASLRAFAANWTDAIRFRTVSRGDTLGYLDSVGIECIWPPDSQELGGEFLDHADRNRLSLCFIVSFGETRVLLTGDIDSVATKQLSARYGARLRADAVVVPHHGSRGSLDPVFYGYVNPDAAMISCGIDNTYGHPAEEVIRLLAIQMSVVVYDTRFDGHVFGTSNG